MSAETKTDAVRSFCMAAYAGKGLGSAECYDNFKSRFAEDIIHKKWQCSNFKLTLQKRPGSEQWFDTGGGVFMYVGNEEEWRGWSFFSAECAFYNIEGDAKVFKGLAD